MVSIDHLRAFVVDLEPRRRESAARAAVAAIARDQTEGLEFLFIRRAEDERDPWSGHMAFPGGRVDADDADGLAAATRETQEELALDLDAEATLVGPLSHVTAVAHGRRLGLVIEPYVFELTGRGELSPNHEVEEALWIPLAFFLDSARRETMTYAIDGASWTLPCYRWEGRVVWGLTLRILDEVIAGLSDIPCTDWPVR